MGGEAQNLDLVGRHKISPFDADSEYKTATAFDEKIYFIAESGKGANLSVTVRIFIKTTGEWIAPTVLGTKPVPSNGHTASLINGDRILVIKQNSSPDECAWFLELDTPFVKDKKKILGTEVVAWSKGTSGDILTPVVISGPSGVGKGTLISKLMEEFPSTFGFSVSHTTRLPREKEIDGVHYHFTQRSKMEKDILDGKFLETALVHGNLYGTSIEAVETVTDNGKICILDIDVQGARSVRASPIEAIFIFIAPPTFDELEKRLRSRGTETEEQIQKRLRNAKTELEQGKAPGLFDHILVNDNLDACYENLKKILGLDGSSNGYQPCRNGKEPPICEKSIQKFEVDCRSNEIGKEDKTLFVLDISSLKGGAPGRTRGLKIDVSKQQRHVPC